MRRIVHLSDIHFGTTDNGIVDRAVEKINELAPDVVVVSGDLTQRAKSAELDDPLQSAIGALRQGNSAPVPSTGGRTRSRVPS